MRKRAGALIIQNKSLLLINEGGQNFYWTPGGGLASGETFEQALVRELREELAIEIETATRFLQFDDTAANETVCYFLTSLQSTPAPPSPETKLLYYAREDYYTHTILISRRIYERVFPELMHAGLV